MKIALLGYGDEGKSAYNYYSKLYPEAHFTIYDQQQTPKYKLSEGVEYKAGLKDFLNIQADIVVRTPSIAPSKIATTGKVTSVTKEFFDRCPANIIGVTGTKGKGTTCSIIKAILKAAGKKVWLVGNIGVPALDALDKITKNDIVIYELSSFQLWDLTKSPHVAVILDIEPEHLNVHENFNDYVSAKANITKWQTADDIALYHSSSDGLSKQIALTSKGQKIQYLDTSSAHMDDDYFWMADQKICPVNALTLPGRHNIDNTCAAIAAAWQWVKDPQAIEKGIRLAKGLPHRLELVKKIDDVAFYDDSYSSAPASTKVAIKAFDKPVILIAGGYDRGLDYTELAQAIVAQPNVKKVLLIGQTKRKIAKKLPADLVKSCNDLAMAISYAYQIAQAGDIVLLSPGCASFDMFDNFTQRGEIFKQLVHDL